MINQKILGVLYGMAIGDAMGMPPELWSREKLIENYGEIDDFLDGHCENIISYQYKRGEFTDDTAQALVILDSLINTDFVPNHASLAKHILNWAKENDAFEKNILGPTSKATLACIEKGEDAREFSNNALSNGAAMRIPPIGTLFESKDIEKLVEYVAKISKVTHSSDITIAGAAMIASAVSAAIDNKTREEMIEIAIKASESAMALGASTVSASLKTRVEYGVSLATRYKDNKTKFLEELYNMMGAGVNTVDSVPCAIAIAFFSWGDVKNAAILSANLGGDTDTIGAMATAICGGVNGINGIPKSYIKLIDEANNVNFEQYANILVKKRGALN